MSILSLNNVHLHLGNQHILDGVNFQIQPKDRIAVVGRNGAGKSSLLKLLEGELTVDKGQLQKQQGLRVAGLTQDVPVSREETVYHFLVKGFGEIGEVLNRFRLLSHEGSLDDLADCQQQIDSLHAWEFLPRIETMASRLDIPCDAIMNHLSGGMRRRVLLAAALLAEADLLLLDEPTNHLDIAAIEWLESWIKQYPGSVLVITHDRQFLSQVANRIVEIDRGNLHVHECNYTTYLDRREAQRLAEQKHADLFDKRLQQEEAWIREGVKARRTRNEGRVRRLKAMRDTYRQRREQLGKAQKATLQTSYSGKRVIEAEDICYRIPGQEADLIHHFTLSLIRGDKIGIIGANGCGKTTLVRLLLGELAPTSGIVKHGTSLEIGYFDQLRRQIDEQQTVMANVADGSDHVIINGQSKHVASYLRDFLFSPEQFNQPVSSLSGGERNRLMLAKLFAKSVNLLVMDEPTNDLDIETLELLETMLMEYQGTLLLISHDREFINQIVSSVLVYEGNGHFEEFVGGYDDYQQHQKQKNVKVTKALKENVIKPKAPTPQKLTFHEQQELKLLPEKVEMLEKQIQAMQLEMTTTDFYQQAAEKLNVFHTKLNQLETSLSELYTRWELLENKE